MNNFNIAVNFLTSTTVSPSQVGYIDVFSDPGKYTWTKRPGVTTAVVLMYGAGGGGGSGAFYTATGLSPTAVGGAGGMGGEMKFISSNFLKSTGTVYVGLGGRGGKSKSSWSDGEDGLAGGATYVEIFTDLDRETVLGGFGGERGYTGFVGKFTGVKGGKGGGYYGNQIPIWPGTGGNSKTATSFFSDYPLAGFNGGVVFDSISTNLTLTSTTTNMLFKSGGGGGGGGGGATLQGFENKLRAAEGGNSSRISGLYTNTNSTQEIILMAEGGLGCTGTNSSMTDGNSGTKIAINLHHSTQTAQVYYATGGGGGGGAIGMSVSAGTGGNGAWPSGGGGGGGAVGFYSRDSVRGTIKSGAGGAGANGLIVVISYV